MKRSELVTRIEEYLLHTQHLDIPCSIGSDFKAAAEELVVLIENVGMLPPVDKEHFLDRVAMIIKEEHIENHGYPMTEKRKYYAMRGASLSVKTTWEPEDD